MRPSTLVSPAFIAALFVAMALCGGRAVHGQITDCSGLSEISGYKVLLDDIEYTGSAESQPPDLDFAIELVRVTLELNLQELLVREPHGGSRVSVLRCEGRRPAGHGDFDEDLVDLLDVRKVLVELWGDVTTSGDGPERSSMALLKDLLVPVHARDGSSGPAFQVEVRTNATPSSTAIHDLLSQDSNLRAFTAIGFGLDKLETGDYDSAREHLCTAQGMIAQSESANATLLAYLDDVNAAVVEQAKNDDAYAGILKLPGIGACQ